MPAAALQNIGLLAGWSLGENGWDVGLNANLRALDLFGMPVVQSVGSNTPPSTSNGVAYIVGTSGGGAWSGQSNKVARYNGTAWEFFTPMNGWQFYSVADLAPFRYDGSTWKNSRDRAIITDSTTARNLDNLTDHNAYLRFTNTAAKTLTVRGNSTHAIRTGFQTVIANRAATGDITVTPTGAASVNAPSGGTLVIAPGVTRTLQWVATDMFDLY